MREGRSVGYLLESPLGELTVLPTTPLIYRRAQATHWHYNMHMREMLWYWNCTYYIPLLYKSASRASQHFSNLNRPLWESSSTVKLRKTLRLGPLVEMLGDDETNVLDWSRSLLGDEGRGETAWLLAGLLGDDGMKKWWQMWWWSSSMWSSFIDLLGDSSDVRAKMGWC